MYCNKKFNINFEFKLKVSNMNPERLMKENKIWIGRKSLEATRNAKTRE